MAAGTANWRRGVAWVESVALALALALATACGSSEPAAASASGGGGSGAGGSGGGGDAQATGGSGAVGGAADGGPAGFVVLPASLSAPDAPLKLLADGDPLVVGPAPQGGYFSFVTARFGPFQADEVELVVRVKEPGTGRVVREDLRKGPVVKVPGTAGLVEADPLYRGAVAHLAMCPIQDEPLVGKEWDLEVTVTPNNPVSGTGTVRVTPSCAPVDGGTQSICECTCAPGWQPGSCY